MKKALKRTLGILLAVVMVCSVFTALPLTASAADDTLTVEFYDWDGENQLLTLTFQENDSWNKIEESDETSVLWSVPNNDCYEFFAYGCKDAEGKITIVYTNKNSESHELNAEYPTTGAHRDSYTFNQLKALANGGTLKLYALYSPNLYVYFYDETGDELYGGFFYGEGYWNETITQVNQILELVPGFDGYRNPSADNGYSFTGWYTGKNKSGKLLYSTDDGENVTDILKADYGVLFGLYKDLQWAELEENFIYALNLYAGFEKNAEESTYTIDFLDYGTNQPIGDGLELESGKDYTHLTADNFDNYSDLVQSRDGFDFKGYCNEAGDLLYEYDSINGGFNWKGSKNVLTDVKDMLNGTDTTILTLFAKFEEQKDYFGYLYLQFADDFEFDPEQPAGSSYVSLNIFDLFWDDFDNRNEYFVSRDKFKEKLEELNLVEISINDHPELFPQSEENETGFTVPEKQVFEGYCVRDFETGSKGLRMYDYDASEGVLRFVGREDYDSLVTFFETNLTPYEDWGLTLYTDFSGEGEIPVAITRPTVMGYTLTLDGMVSMNFYVKHCGFTYTTKNIEDQNQTANYENNYIIKVERQNSDEGKSPRMILGAPIRSGDYDKFNIKVNAKEMADVFKLDIVYVKDGNIEKVYDEKGYSVQKYAETLLGNDEDYFHEQGIHSEEQIEKLKTLCKAMLNYGAASQVQFNYNTGNYANSNITDYSVPNISASDFEKYNYDYSELKSKFNAEYYASSIGLLDCLGYTVCLKISNISSPYTRVFVNGYDIGDNSLSEYNGYPYYTLSDNIAAKDLLEDITVTIKQTDTNESKDYTVLKEQNFVFNPGSYIRRALLSNDPTLIYTVSALYDYSVKAKDYFEFV